MGSMERKLSILDANSKTAKRIGGYIMDRQRAKDLLPIIKAFAENRPIERRTIGSTNWTDTNQICLQLYEEKKDNIRRIRDDGISSYHQDRQGDNESAFL